MKLKVQRHPRSSFSFASGLLQIYQSLFQCWFLDGVE